MSVLMVMAMEIAPECGKTEEMIFSITREVTLLYPLKLGNAHINIDGAREEMLGGKC